MKDDKMKTQTIEWGDFIRVLVREDSPQGSRQDFVDHFNFIFTSTPPSRPNKVGLKCPSVRPQKVSSISMKFGMQVEVDEWCMAVCSMTLFKVKVKTPWKSEIQPFSKAISTIYKGAGKWPRILKLRHNT